MKTKSILKNLAIVLMTIVAFSCSKSEDDSPGNGGGGQAATSISLNANSLTVIVGESVLFTVIDNLGTNVTSSSEFKINNTVISNPYVFDTAGSFEVVASNGNLTNSATITVNVPPVPSSITLSVDNDALWYDTGNVTFTVMDDLGNNLTGLAVYTAETGTLTNPATFTTAGTYNASATYTLPDNSTLTSNSVEVKAVESTHTTKVLLEDYTGTWCGFCPRLATALEEAVNMNSNLIPVAIHDDNEMLFPFATQMENAFGVTGFPSGRVNRTIVWNESTSQPISYLAERQNMGLAINSSIAGNTITAEVKVHYDLKASSANRLVVYLLENGLVYNQVNYYNESNCRFCS